MNPECEELALLVESTVYSEPGSEASVVDVEDHENGKMVEESSGGWCSARTAKFVFAELLDWEWYWTIVKKKMSRLSISGQSQNVTNYVFSSGRNLDLGNNPDFLEAVKQACGKKSAKAK